MTCSIKNTLELNFFFCALAQYRYQNVLVSSVTLRFFSRCMFNFPDYTNSLSASMKCAPSANKEFKDTAVLNV